jgi:hypothetical protein
VDTSNLVNQIVAQQLAEKAPTRRHYIGYEDYSPEGRAAIAAFNSMKGSHYLEGNNPADIAKYQAAAAAAKKAAEAVMAQIYNEKAKSGLSQQQVLGYEQTPNAPPMNYIYPPKD